MLGAFADARGCRRCWSASASSTTMPRLTASAGARARARHSAGCRPRPRRGRPAMHAAVRQLDAPRRVPSPSIARGLGLEQHVDAAAPRPRACSSAAARGVELALHQPVHQMDERDARRRPWRGRRPPRARAGRRRSRPRACRRRPPCRIASTSPRSRKVMHAGQLRAGHRQPDRPRAGREHQLGDRAASRRRRGARGGMSVSIAVAAAAVDAA